MKEGEFCLWIWGTRNGDTYRAYKMVFSKDLNDELLGKEDFIEQFPEYEKLGNCDEQNLSCAAHYLNSFPED